MNLASVLGLLGAADFGQGNHAVFGSGPLLVRGIIDSVSDIDVIARGSAWELARTSGELRYLPEHGVTVASFFNGKLTVGTEWAIGNVNIDAAIDTADLIEGVPWVSLDLVAEYKKTAGRPKDLEHLERLQQWLRQV